MAARKKRRPGLGGGKWAGEKAAGELKTLWALAILDRR